ncbi:phosphatidylinositol-specific phospholipase C [Clostridium tarantellae]|uniref:1-phosphatidylinositol phosphodiesterase n=1 Tax=Clostridium tarantellae TaxID=39493 RepID=A0A6I1MPG3_9CLOT|nr:phosphatidylinositol-specific phospholipase C [Clostridium tarantellae]MPQ44358.1 phosphatidylinositol-specific phospholipase C domain-containing protein [Clostridium tarantellae]
MGNCIDYAYSHDDGICAGEPRWLSKLDQNTRLSQLSLPGTHDTMSLGWGGDIAQTQSKSLDSQLNSGIRFLDIRLAAKPNSSDPLKAHHGIVYLHSSFKKILDIVTKFLAFNYTETVIMRIKQENTKESDATFLNLLRKFTDDPNYSQFIYNFTGNVNPTLNEMKRKIVILQNFGGELKWIPYTSTFTIQDSYDLRNNWDLYKKWNSVKNHLYNANYSASRNVAKGFINYLNGSGGVFPYFVASGHSSPQTNAPLLSTGLTEPAFKNHYPDFPRINRLGVFSTIAFQGTNKLTKAYIDQNKPSYVGIVVADFPQQGLINSIINVNKIIRNFTPR